MWLLEMSLLFLHHQQSVKKHLGADVNPGSLLWLDGACEFSFFNLSSIGLLLH